MSKNVEKLLYFFNEISKIPRETGKEEKIATYLEKFATERDLECYRDISNNVLIKKKGNIDSKNILILQSHIDMVCVKSKDSIHNFDIDPINIIREGDVIRADNTSLGGDDGIGMAIMLYILDSKDIKHTNLECLFTTQEETTFGGAINFDYTKLTGKNLVNLDGCEDDKIIVGCDGDRCIKYSSRLELIENDLSSYQIIISNLIGGNAGIEIENNRINAIELMGKVLTELRKDKFVFIKSINGGTSEVDIANACECIINTDIEKIEDKIKKLFSQYNFIDEKPKIEVKQIENVETFNLENSNHIIDEIINLKSGIITKEKNKIVTFGSIGKIETNIEEVIITTLYGSSNVAELEKIAKENRNISQEYRFDTQEIYRDSNWQGMEESKLRDKYVNSYYKVNSKYPEIKSIHAIIECSVFAKKIPEIDMISIGPIIESFHTINEKIYVSSCEKILNTFVDFLENF